MLNYLGGRSPRAQVERQIQVVSFQDNSGLFAPKHVGRGYHHRTFPPSGSFGYNRAARRKPTCPVAQERQDERLVPRGVNEWSPAADTVARSIELSNASFLGLRLLYVPRRARARPGATRTRTQQRLRRTPRQTGRAGRRADHPLGIRRPRGSFPDLHFCAGRKFLLSHRPQRRRRRTLDSSRGQRRLRGRTARNFVSSREESRKRKMERFPNVSVGSRHRSAYRICYGETIRQRLPPHDRKSCKNVSGFLHDSSLSEGTRRL